MYIDRLVEQFLKQIQPHMQVFSKTPHFGWSRMGLHVIVTRNITCYFCRCAQSHPAATPFTLCGRRVMPETPVGAHGDSNGIAAEINVNHAPPLLPLPELCANIHQRLEAFLNAEPRDQRMRAVQEQSRKSLEVIEEALRRYR